MKYSESAKIRKQSRSVFNIGNIATALAGFIFWLCLSVTIVVNMRQIYYFDIDYLHIAEETGIESDVIRKNYDVLIDYNTLGKGRETLEFPDFPMSDHGRIHFEEVKRVFLLFQYGCIITGILLLFMLVYRFLHHDYGSLKLMSIFSLLIPTVLGILVAINWEAFFIQFHKLVFNNDYWLFDPVTDPIILILPDEFFLHCAAAILLLLVLGCMISAVLYRILSRRERL